MARVSDAANIPPNDIGMFKGLQISSLSALFTLLFRDRLGCNGFQLNSLASIWLSVVHLKIEFEIHGENLQCIACTGEVQRNGAFLEG